MNYRSFFNDTDIAVSDTEDANEQIARDMMADGLSGTADTDTWTLNARLDRRHFQAHHRQRHDPLDLAS